MGDRTSRGGGSRARRSGRSGEVVVDKRGVIAYALVATGFVVVAVAVDNVGVRVVFLLAASAVGLFAAGWAGWGPLKRTRS